MLMLETELRAGDRLWCKEPEPSLATDVPRLQVAGDRGFALTADARAGDLVWC